MVERVSNPQACGQCPLQHRDGFRPHGERETAAIQAWKDREIAVAAGDLLYEQGEQDAALYTVLAGWGFRYATLPDGRRQILNYVFPGDFLGLQSVLKEARTHAVEALTPMRLCQFDQTDMPGVFGDQPDLAFDVTWASAQEERFLESHLVGVGRRSALERIAYMLAYIVGRGRKSGLLQPGDPIAPMTQGHLADTLGMSLVHTNKTLRLLQSDGLVRWRGRRVYVDDLEGLSRVARWQGPAEGPRRFV